MKNPLVSIVIANYNYGRFLEDAIRSVISQNDSNIAELIVCDAASCDNSVEIIKKHEGKIAWWCSERDGGQSAAINKGFSHARGEWLTWLNADDVLLPGTLNAFSTLVEREKNARWISGNMLSFDEATKRILKVNWGPHRQPPLLKKSKAFNAVFGPTTFVRRDLYFAAGAIDERLHFAMDTEYWARLTMLGINQTRLNHICWAFRFHCDSKTEGEQTAVQSEKRKKETEYWHRKTAYYFRPTFRNPFYVLWVFWRLVDGSWIVRLIKKIKWEGKPLVAYLDLQNGI